jgi:hypothetical protein
MERNQRQGVVLDLVQLFAHRKCPRDHLFKVSMRVESCLYEIAATREEYLNRATLSNRAIMALDVNFLRLAVNSEQYSYPAACLKNWKHAVRCTGCDQGHNCAALDMCPLKGKCLGSVRAHISSCRVHHCPEPHCFVTRALLDHVRACRVECALCAPYRHIRPQERLTVMSTLDTHELIAHVATFPPLTASGCGLCGQTELVLPPANYYCDGPCERPIRRNALFSRNSDDTRHFCKPCAPANQLLRNDEICLDKMAVCEGCRRSVHFVCAMIGPVQLPRFVCPRCLLQTRLRLEIYCGTVPAKPIGVAVPYMEESVRSILPGETLFVRHLARTTLKTEVPERVRQHFPDMPSELPGNESCFGLFQIIDGLPVLIFLFYAQEYGADCPEPNRNRVYISYVDSVNYFQPKGLRTAVYQRLLLAYIQTASDRGFKACHLWSCPPCKNDEYIFVGHPAAQKRPAKAKLLEWYQTMARVDSLSVAHFADEFKDATPPFFAGDAWAVEAGKAKTVAAARVEMARHRPYCLVLPLEGAASAPPFVDLIDSVFANRIDFMLFCRRNHLQFSSLLFAKYATMVAVGAY